jgi:exopolyphosphatase/guanosine-5'-triphosphate,3'-diphosphate pyrophosphatase
MSVRIAGIDIGTNSVLYSLFEVRGKKITAEVHEQRYSPRIGQKLAGMIKPAITRDNFMNLKKLMGKIVRHARSHGAEHILIAATNPFRIAQNGQQAQCCLEKEIKEPVVILTPEREAYLSFLAAAGRLQSNRTAMTIDMGGGSTELVVYRGKTRKAFVSIPEGAVSLTEAFDSTGKVDPGAYPEFETYLAKYDKQIASVAQYASAPIWTVGGTSSILGYLKDERIFDRPRGVVISQTELDGYIALLGRLGITCRRQLLTVDKKRAEIIFAGAFWYSYLFKRLGVTKVTATPRGLRHGIVLDFLDRGSFTA